MSVSNDLLPPGQPTPRTIMCPFIPIIKSNHGSNGRSGFLFRSTWKPYALSLLCDCVEDVSASRLLIRRFRAPNMVLAVDSCIFSYILLFLSPSLFPFLLLLSPSLVVFLLSFCFVNYSKLTATSTWPNLVANKTNTARNILTSSITSLSTPKPKE